MSYSSIFVRILSVGSLLFALNSCGLFRSSVPDVPPDKVIKDGVVVTVSDQKLSLLRNGKAVKTYDISTSKFGLGSKNGSYKTPTGVHAVASKVGQGMPQGMVFHGARATGEIVQPNSPGRDPIVSRIIQLVGLEAGNANSYSRRIYIHGTAEESTIGSPASYGCIRMKSKDVVELFNLVNKGEPVAIASCSQKTYLNTIAAPNSTPVIFGHNVTEPSSAIAAVGTRHRSSSAKKGKYRSRSRVAATAKAKNYKPKKMRKKAKKPVRLVSVSPRKKSKG